MVSKKQLQIKGTERKVIKEVSDAASHYAECRDVRMAHTVKEKDSKVALIEAMKKHGLGTYTDPDAVPPFTVTVVEGKANVKVEKKNPEGDEVEDEAA